jgi:ribosome-associated protein
MRKAGAKPVRREGEREGRWVLLDYLDIVIHVQHADERAFYALERLWKDCPQIQLPEPVGARSGGSAGGDPR